MALTFSDAIRDQVCRNLVGVAYANVTDTDYKDTIVYCGADALVTIQKYAQYAEQAGATAAPDEWANWLLWRTTLLAGMSIQPDRVALYQRQHDDAMFAAIGSFARTDLNGSDLGTESLAITVKGIRRYVVATALGRTRSQKGREPLLVEPSLVDSEIQWALGLYWNQRGYKFRQRKVTLTIDTDNSVTVNGLSDEEMDAINTRLLYYSESGAVIRWMGADEMARRRAYDTEHSETGRPFGFRVENKSGTWTWTFTPTPDKEYTVYTEALVAGPGTPGDTTEADVFQRFNPEDGPILRDLVLGKILKTHGAEGGAGLLSDAMDQLHALGTINDDIGKPDDEQAVRDVYHDARYLGGGWGTMIGEGS